MATTTNLFRHLSARWLTRESANNNIYCGVSKTLLLNDTTPEEFNESFDYVNEALSSCVVFSKLKSSFVVESDDSDYDVKLLTKQIYTRNNIVDEHTFLDNIMYWKYITDEEALGIRTYNTIANFVLDNSDSTQSTNFQNLKTFYFFFNLKINGNKPNNNGQDYFQFIPSSSDILTADGIIMLEKLSYVYDNVDSGVCDKITNDISVPYDYNCKINYFVSF